jgi:glycosyltransferase involved in cell wall biosynthesis
VKVLFLNPIGKVGGAERSLLDLIRSLRQATDSVEVTVGAFAAGPLLDAASAMGCDVLVIPLPAGLVRLGDSGLSDSTNSRNPLLAILGALALTPGFVLQLHRELGRVAPDIVHTNGFKAHILAAIARPRDAALVWHLRDFVSARPFVRRCLPLVAKRAHLAIAISEAVASDARGILSLPVVTLLNAVDTDYFAPAAVEPLDLDRAAGLSSTSDRVTRVGLVGTYAWWKGHDLFLRTAALLRELPIRFFVIGGQIYETTGSQRTESDLRARISELGLTGRAGLVPFQSDPRPAYLALDIVVQASTTPEPFGRTVAEAMASGRAVVASAAGGVLEQIENGRTGILSPVNDTAALARAIASLHSSPELRSALGAAAREAAVRTLDARRLGPAALRMYRELCSPPTRPSRTSHGTEIA